MLRATTRGLLQVSDFSVNQIDPAQQGFGMADHLLRIGGAPKIIQYNPNAPIGR
jgi:hypothetical protein